MDYSEIYTTLIITLSYSNLFIAALKSKNDTY